MCYGVWGDGEREVGVSCGEGLGVIKGEILVIDGKKIVSDTAY